MLPIACQYLACVQEYLTIVREMIRISISILILENNMYVFSRPDSSASTAVVSSHAGYMKQP